jgi:hypothetical protein
METDPDRLAEEEPSRDADPSPEGAIGTAARRAAWSLPSSV